MTSPTSAKKIVQDGYDAIAPAYHDFIKDRASHKLVRIQELLGQLPADATVLDLGCGSGEPVTRLLSERFRTTGVDISAAQIALAKKHAPLAHFGVGDMATVEYNEGQFDAVVAFYSIIHLPREEQAVLIGKIHGWLKKGGRLLLNLSTVAEEGAVQEWLGANMYYSSYDGEQNRALVERAGFVIDSAEVLPEEGLTDMNDPDNGVRFIWFVAHKA